MWHREVVWRSRRFASWVGSPSSCLLKVLSGRVHRRCDQRASVGLLVCSHPAAKDPVSSSGSLLSPTPLAAVPTVDLSSADPRASDPAHLVCWSLGPWHAGVGLCSLGLTSYRTGRVRVRGGGTLRSSGGANGVVCSSGRLPFLLSPKHAVGAHTTTV